MKKALANMLENLVHLYVSPDIKTASIFPSLLVLGLMMLIEIIFGLTVIVLLAKSLL